MNPKDTLPPQVGNAAAQVRERFKGLKPAHKTALVILLLAVAWMGSGLFKSADQAVPTGLAARNGEQVVVRVRVQTSRSVAHTPTISLLGRVQAGQAVSVRTEIPGRVAEIVTEKGTRVEAGQVLMRIDAEDRAQRQAEAAARLKQREIAYESAKKLSQGGYSSQLNVAQSQADLEAARALVTRMERELANTEIKAPFAGVVDAVPVEAGDYFDKAGQIAATVLDLTEIKAVGQVTERDVSNVAAGGPARIRLPDGRELQGTVTFVGMSSNALTRTFPVEITAPVPDSSVPEGVTAEIILPLESIEGHHISPALLTLDDQGQIGVKTVNAEEVIEFHPVQLSSDTMAGAWLTGLPSEIRIITVGQEFVRVGEKVIAIEGELKTMRPANGQAPNTGAGN